VPYIEPLCFGIVALYLALRLGRAPAGERGAVALRLALLACAGWIGEATCVRGYGFYRYALPDEGGPWRLWLDVVPLVVVLTWPVVIHSAWELARSLSTRSPSVGRRVLLCALIVLADASLIEPIAVAVGLWSWTEPGPFAVPLIGVLGWSLFTLWAAFALERGERAREARQGAGAWSLVLVTAGLWVHLPLLALWWGGLRWLAPLALGPALVLVTLANLAAFKAAAQGPRPDPGALWLRAPGAGFFFALLAWGVRDPWLWAWALAFGLPYLVLTLRAGRSEPIEGIA
jgi:carotenoid biosynthesis protein